MELAVLTGKWVQDGYDLAAKYASAGFDLPGFLAPFAVAGDDDRGAGDVRVSDLPPFPPPPGPFGVPPEWLWVRVSDAGPGVLVQAVLREHGEPMQAQEIAKRIQRAGSGAVTNSIYNSIQRLRPRVLKDGVLGLELVDPESAPVIHKDYVWGPEKSFGMYEIADFRRRLIEHILKSSPHPLTVMEIVDLVNGWHHKPLEATGKDAIKADLEFLAKANRAVRNDENRRWSVKTDDAPK